MKIGFIGTGNMGGAILKGFAPTAGQQGDTVLAYDRNSGKLAELKKQYGIAACESTAELVRECDIIILGVKPGIFETVLPEAAEAYDAGKTVVSMAAGVSTAFIEKYLGKNAMVIRIMPNTAALIGQAMTAVSRNGNVSEEMFSKVMEILNSVGRAEPVPENLIDCVTGVSGSSPAYTYMYIDALAEAAEKNGMDRKKAEIFAAQSVLGAAEMVLNTGEDPGKLRDNVCSPGGTTIEAVRVLRDNGFCDDVAEAFQAAVEKSKKMTK